MPAQKKCLQVLQLLIVLSVMCTMIDKCACGTNSKCKLLFYNHKAVQTDMRGRRCWGDVRILACKGYCLSYEIADWQFPYKESHHPVCVHSERRHASAILRHCDEDVEPGTEVYHYIEAKNCKCKVCSSDDTSCEWLPPGTEALGELLLHQQTDQEFD